MGVCMSIDEDTLHIACGADAMAKHRSKKKLVMEVLEAEAKVYQLLCKMPGRLSTNGATVHSCAFSKQGRKGVNQDCLLVWEEFAAQENMVFCGVFDGHGPNGHLVARKVRDSLPVLLALPLSLLREAYVHEPTCTSFHDCPAGEKDEDDHNCTDNHTRKLVDSPSHSDVFAVWKEKLVTAYKLMDSNLKTHPKVKCLESGTTAVTMVIQGDELIIGSVGDSRAVLAKRGAEGYLVADQVTVDLKPNLPGELERIRRCKGRVFALECEPDVARVWMPHSDSPGLAMARALGDFCLKEYGLSEVPEVFYRSLTQQHEFIILATDGIWDVISNEEAVRIVASTFPKEEAANALVQAAVKKWKKRHAAWRTDDCSAVCYFLRDAILPSYKPNTAHCNTPITNGHDLASHVHRDSNHEDEPMDMLF